MRSLWFWTIFVTVTPVWAEEPCPQHVIEVADVNLSSGLAKIMMARASDLVALRRAQLLEMRASAESVHQAAIAVDRDYLRLKGRLRAEVKALFGGDLPNRFLTLELVPDIRQARAETVIGFDFRFLSESEEGRWMWKKTKTTEVLGRVRGYGGGVEVCLNEVCSWHRQNGERECGVQTTDLR